MASNTDGDNLATQIAAELNRNSRYNVLSSATDPVKTKLTELRKQDASSIDRNALAAWGRTNGIATICLVTDAIKGSDHMFYAHLIDAKDSKLSGKGSYVCNGVGNGDVSRVALALAKQLDGSGRRQSPPASARTYPAELDIEMVFVEGGTFTMGCTAEQGNNCQSNWEVPAHTVTVSSFYIGKYEVTRAQWKAAMKGHARENTGNWTDDDQLPIESVSYNDITGVDGFLKRLNAQTGKNYRLPTEAEWEYAARGGKHKSPYMYSGSNNVDEVAWYRGNSGNRTHVVGGKKPNALGIYDMSANSCELCSDKWSTTYYGTSNGAVDPKGPNDGTEYVVRGGNQGDIAATGVGGYHPRVSSRRGIGADDRNIWVSLRVALPAQ
jgi:formylglycine-generating enzyme required for sulfatase activity